MAYSLSSLFFNASKFYNINSHILTDKNFMEEGNFHFSLFICIIRYFAYVHNHPNKIILEYKSKQF